MTTVVLLYTESTTYLEEKENDFANCGCGVMTDDVIRLREEIAEQKKH